MDADRHDTRLIDRLNASGWKGVSIYQYGTDEWWVSVMRGELYYATMFRPTAVDAWTKRYGWWQHDRHLPTACRTSGIRRVDGSLHLVLVPPVAKMAVRLPAGPLHALGRIQVDTRGGKARPDGGDGMITYTNEDCKAGMARYPGQALRPWR